MLIFLYCHSETPSYYKHWLWNRAH